jgi:hypothetical protein
MLASGEQYELSVVLRVANSTLRPRVTLELLSAASFGGAEQPLGLALAEGQWTLDQRLAVVSPADVPVRLKLTYSGWGPLWLCEARLVRSDDRDPELRAQAAASDRAVEMLEPCLRCQDCVVDQYREHRDLLYSLDASGSYQEFVQEYSGGTGLRRTLQDIVVSGGRIMGQLLSEALRDDSTTTARMSLLSDGAFDVQKSESRDLVLVNTVRCIDASLDQGEVDAAASKLAALQNGFGESLLVMSRARRLCQIAPDNELCTGISADAFHQWRLQPWTDARLTGLMAALALDLYDEGVWDEKSLVSVADYVVWQHAAEEEASQFIGAVSGRDLEDARWAELREEMEWRNDPTRRLTSPHPQSASISGGANLLGDPSLWQFEVHDDAPYRGGTYYGGVDEYACPDGSSALRMDGSWSAAEGGGPGSWAGYVSNGFALQPGQTYELYLTLRAGDSRGGVYLQFFPDRLFGPDSSFRLSLPQSDWVVVKQLVSNQSSASVEAQLRVRHLGSGPLWICEPYLICTSCEGGSAAPPAEGGDHKVSLSEPLPMCRECE